MQLKEYRLSKKLSTKDFSEKLGVNLSTLFRYETGARFPSREVLVRIKEVTKGKVTANDFVEAG